MKRRFLFLTVVAALLLTFMAGAAPAQAQVQYYYSLTGVNGTCSGSVGNVTMSGSLPRLAYVPAGNVIRFASTNMDIGSGTFSIGAQGPGSVGTFTTFSSGTGPEPVDAMVELILAVDGVDVWITRIRLRCTGPAGTPTILELIAQPIGTETYAGPPIPAEFELRTITCDVAVFDMPGGNPVGSNRIIGGQTWYVNTVPVKAADGSSWTEIFVSSIINGYIPTRCVG